MKLNTILQMRGKIPFPPPASGLSVYREGTEKVIRLLLKGCVNRPFYHIAVQEKREHFGNPVIEQLGTYDAMPNKFNEKLVSLNFERIEFWLKKGAEPTPPIREILGLAGYFPVHYRTSRRAWLNRKRLLEEIERQKKKLIEAQQSSESKESQLEQ